MSEHITIEVQYGGKSAQFKVCALDSLWSLKEKIRTLWGVHIFEQRLYMNGTELCVDEATFETIAVITGPKDKLPHNWRITLETDFCAPIEPKDIPNFSRIPWDVGKVVEILNKARKDIAIISAKERVSQDNEDASRMVLSAKESNWDDVLSILYTKPYIINVIPQERAWSVLHQAAFQDNHDVLIKLISFSTCDINIKAKRDRNQHGGTGMTPYQLAQKHGNSCQEILQHQTNDTIIIELTFLEERKGKAFVSNGVPYYDLASSFLKTTILKSLNLEGCGVLYLTQRMYELLENDWRYVRTTVTECLYPFDKLIADHLANAKSPDDLKEAMIWIYTSNLVYKQVNAALRRASENEFPVADDLLLSLYSLFLASTLLHWKKLRKVAYPTYRCLALTKDQAKHYQKGTTFYWLPFTSSTKLRSIAKHFALPEHDSKPVLFEIENSEESIWSARDIAPYSSCGHEMEAVFPPCAKFCVTGVKDISIHTAYSVKLMS